ncbi:type II toxin-antitoxin system RelE/ParE family toxin [Aquiflexum sp. TKW24L]|uniref:type II toxin-antitoxin system RelE/ParE family toxin n=1 Tax=Aquiflexum sp. TKW24L TaxID=2942212 RepID=UPI0020C15A9F|nr:type II toxin-antitoxin system RelE/ParE family toxin [Aquiflexum sp. TKW24L]MCL6261539.1 type II toxin-antitoxin system RelE/ParE family toxin [Aquiflexum sp. TKW24L]
MGIYYLSNKAVEDLSEIWEYTFDVWSEDQADKYYEFLLSTCQELALIPEKGKSYDKIRKNLLGYLANRHVIFYVVKPEMEIEIIRILHEKMDMKNRIND